MTATRSILLQRLAPYKGAERVLVGAQDTGDIMDGIARWHKRYRDEYEKIAPLFLGSTPEQTARNLFNYLKSNVSYQIETEEKQTLKSPAAIVAQGVGDCKHYALFAGGVLDALGRQGLQRIPWAFRFASYRWYDETPQHVFVVMYPNTDREIWIDPVLTQLNQRKAYTHKIDTKMALVGISGVAPGQVGGIKTVLKKGKTAVLKVAAAPARAAFLGLVALNVFGLATKLSETWRRNPADLRNWWEGLGGAIGVLTKNIEKGSAKKRIGASVGVEPVTTSAAALITAASPVLLALISLFKKTGQDYAEFEGASAAALNERAQDAAGDTLVPDFYDDEQQQAGADAVTSRAGIPTVALVAGGALVLILLTRKK